MLPTDARKTALDILLRVDEGAFADLTLNALLEKGPRMDPRDRALATELVYGVLRTRGRLDFALSQFCKKSLEKVEPKVLWLLRLGAYQILSLEKVPEAAAVHQSVELARRERLERATGFINGILRTLVRQREMIPWPEPQGNALAYLQHVLSIPPWLGKLWIRDLGHDEAFALGESMLTQAPFTLRVNTRCMGRDEFLRHLLENGHEAEPCRFAPEGVIVRRRGPNPLPGNEEGWFQVQDEASMLIAHLLDVHEGQHILDACSAPGGKTTHLAALTEDRARILALDLHPQRVALVAQGAQRLGFSSIETRCWDMALPPDFLGAKVFDRVLVDAPCSGLGVLRRNPEIRWRKNAPDIKSLAELQLKILTHAASRLKPGGRLLYSLCTQTAEETGGVVNRFLSTHPEFATEDLREHVPASWTPLFDEKGALRTFPHRCGGMDAFFAVRFFRKPA